MPKALLRLEDIGPGGYYESAENQRKLLVIAEYLYQRQIPFHVAVIPRFIDPQRSYDCSMSSRHDPLAVRFVQTLNTLRLRGASLGMHGYTHQYGAAVSGEGYEFAYEGCEQNCVPDDSPESLTSWPRLQRSYAFQRFQQGLREFHAAGLPPDWFETPHYAASATQRKILETCAWLFYENHPDHPQTRQVSYRPAASPAGRAYYVPTPLGYIGGATIEQDLNRMMSDADRLADHDLASFFYHPFLEFPYIHLHSNAPPYYEPGSPLRRIIQNLRSRGRRFVSIKELVGLSGR